MAEPSQHTPSKLSVELVQRLDKAGPRYTSYPTANIFSDTFSARAYAEALESASDMDEPIAIYLHLPFCESLCTYCACNVVVRKHIGLAARPYVERILEELDLVLAHLGTDRPLGRLQIGGGTPNYLPLHELDHLVSGIEERLALTEDAELGVEVDPRHVAPGQLDALHGLGFNRVSFGVQDFDPVVQVAIGRNQGADITRNAVREARRSGFESVNIDLVYGLPEQTLERFDTTLDAVLELKPDRLALFSFAYLPTLRPNQRKIEPDAVPEGPAKAAMLVRAVERLTGAGYVQVGIDHFALPDDPLAESFFEGTLHRNFQGYEAGAAWDTIGLGATAIGYVGGVYAQNQHKLGQWLESVTAGDLPVERGWTLSFEDRVRARVIHDLMCRFRLDYAELKDTFDIDHDNYFSDVLPTLDGHAADGLVERNESGITVTPLGKLFVRNVAMSYDAHLPRGGGRFSRTV